MSKEYDVCIVGSGAGGGPVALTLAKAGYSVVVLEKGPWFKQDDFYKDELACCRRSVYTPELKDEMHVLEEYDGQNDLKLSFRMKDKTVTLDVPGMTCKFCPITIRKALKKVPGVT